MVQGDFFNLYPPKNHKYGEKLKYENWHPPKSSKYIEKLKNQNCHPPKSSKYQNHMERLSLGKSFLMDFTLAL